MVLSLDGGKKKKKRKNYTTPKKNKHRHKSVKLHALKYYSIENGVVMRLRKASPNFGPGIWLAKHADRYHCGKSGKCFRIENDEVKE